MCEVEFDGTTEFASIEYRRARKQHYCDECGRSVGAGERHRYDVIKHDGAICTYRTCLPCENLRDWLMHQMKLGTVEETSYVDDCDAFIYGALSEGIGDAFHWKPPPVAPPMVDITLRFYVETMFYDVFAGDAA